MCDLVDPRPASLLNFAASTVALCFCRWQNPNSSTPIVRVPLPFVRSFFHSVVARRFVMPFTLSRRVRKRARIHAIAIKRLADRARRVPEYDGSSTSDHVKKVWHDSYFKATTHYFKFLANLDPLSLIAQAGICPHSYTKTLMAMYTGLW